jgi:predicted nucleic acid-binding protein
MAEVRPTPVLTWISWIEETMEVIPLGTETAEIFGRLKALLEIKGTRLDDFDLMIAACALTHNLTLVTSNEMHFRRIDGLKVTNWVK